MELITYKVVTGHDVREVRGEPIEIRGHRCAITEITQKELPKLPVLAVVSITHLDTGMNICREPSREEAIARANRQLARPDAGKLLDAAKRMIESRGIIYPVNPRQ